MYGLTVTAASGESIAPVGMVECSFTIGKNEFTHNFIICEKIRRSMILGLDFLRKHRIETGWSPQGKFILQSQNQILVETIETFFKEENPKLIAKSEIEIPERSLVVVRARVEIPPEHCERMFDTVPTEEMLEEYPELIVIPLIHKTSQRNYNTVPYVLINIGSEDINIEKGRVLAKLELFPSDIKQITTETNIQINEIKEEIGIEEEIDFKEVLKGVRTEKKFITSPADVEIHRKTDLQDAEVNVEDRKRFEQLCKEYDDVFSKSAEDIGRTPLVTMDIETGDSPPISQRPYSLALKHIEWVHKELEILEKAGVIVRSVSPWASPIVVVPKKSEPGEPPRRRMCVDYRMINSLLPTVSKAHSKAKGVLSLVPLPKINEICAKLKRF